MRRHGASTGRAVAANVPGMRAVLALSLLVALPALAAERIEIPSLEGPEGPAQLVAFLSRPDGPGPFPAVVMLHGCGGAYAPGGRLNARHRQWESLFLREGYAVLQVDSFTPRGIREICKRTERPRTTTARGERRRDALAGHAFLRAQPFIRADRIALAGWSNGGSTVLAAMEADAAGTPSPFRAAIAFYPGCRLAGGAARPGGPMLILSGEADTWTPPEDCRAMLRDAAARAQRIEMHTYPGAYHDFDWPGMAARQITGIGTRSGTTMVGLDPAAQADALTRVPAWLAGWLKD